MLKPVRWALAGGGGVGEAVEDMAGKEEVAARFGLLPRPEAVLRKGGWHEHGKYGEIIEKDKFKLPDVPLLFVAMPSIPGHEPTLSLMRQQLTRGGMVITAEKGAFADHAPELTSLPGQIGFWAAYGGGTKMIERIKLDTVDPTNVRELYSNPNGSTSFMLGRASTDSPDEIETASRHYKFIEPGAKGLVGITQNEMVDVGRKELLKLKMVFSGFNALSMADMDIVLTDDHVEQAFSEPDKYRALTANFHEEDAELAEYMTEGRLGGFLLRHAGLIVVGGMMRLDRVHPWANRPWSDPFMPEKPLELFRMVPGPIAAYYVHHCPRDHSTKDGWSFTVGSGTGADTTANAMLDNSLALRTSSETLLSV